MGGDRIDAFSLWEEMLEDGYFDNVDVLGLIIQILWQYAIMEPILTFYEVAHSFP